MARETAVTTEELLAAILAPCGIVFTVWFWRHCAKPSLAFHRARRSAIGLLLALSVIATVAYGYFVVRVGLPLDLRRVVSPIAQGVLVVWFAIVGLGYLNDFRVLIRLTGGRESTRDVR